MPISLISVINVETCILNSGFGAETRFGRNRLAATFPKSVIGVRLQTLVLMKTERVSCLLKCPHFVLRRRWFGKVPFGPRKFG